MILHTFSLILATAGDEAGVVFLLLIVDRMAIYCLTKFLIYKYIRFRRCKRQALHSTLSANNVCHGSVSRSHTLCSKWIDDNEPLSDCGGVGDAGGVCLNG